MAVQVTNNAPISPFDTGARSVKKKTKKNIYILHLNDDCIANDLFFQIRTKTSTGKQLTESSRGILGNISGHSGREFCFSVFPVES